MYCIVKYGQQDHVFIRHEEEKDIFYLGPDIWPNNDIYYIIENYPELAATNNVAGGRIALKLRDVGFELEGVKKASADEINKLKEKTNDYKVLYDLASMEVENERQKNVEAVNMIALERKAQELSILCLQRTVFAASSRGIGLLCKDIVIRNNIRNPILD